MQQETHDFLTLGKLQEARENSIKKSPAFLHVRCEVENGEDLAKFHSVFSQAWRTGDQSKTLQLLKFLDSQETPRIQ